MSVLRIVLADDHAVVRAALRMLLEAVPGWHVIAEAGDAGDALAAVSTHDPDVLVLDLVMPGRPSLDVLSELRERFPRTRTVVLTMEADPSLAQQALATGAAAYVLKEAADSELVQAIETVAAGGSYLDPSLGAALAAPGLGARSVERLSDRELEVLRLIALGHTNAEVAVLLRLSLRTVESHRAHIQAKTQRTTRAELVDLALRAGLLDRDRRHAASLAHR
jgi:two-component system, NarL family, response regulator NreC